MGATALRRTAVKGGLADREAENAARARSAGWMAVFSPAAVPPLLQTAEYARLALATVPGADEADIARAAAVRVEAQAVLSEPGRKFAFVLTEGALRAWPGSPLPMPAQLDRLARVAELPHVRLGVVPWTAAVPMFPLHGFTIYEGGVSVVETLTGDLTLTAPDELDAHEVAFEAFAAAAVYGDGLRALLDEIRRDYQTPILRLRK